MLLLSDIEIYYHQGPTSADGRSWYWRVIVKYSNPFHNATYTHGDSAETFMAARMAVLHVLDALPPEMPAAIPG
jgi:hypothetical protein